MALIICEECGNQMSDKAQSCPKCGAPNMGLMQRSQQFINQPYVAINPCARHSNAPSVVYCGNCGSAMCKDCKDLSVYTFDNKPLCIDCNIQFMEQQIQHLQLKKHKSIVKFFILAVIVLIALSIFTTDPQNTDVIITAWIVASIGGIFTTLSMTKRSETEKAVDDLYTKLYPDDGLMNEGVGCLTRLLGAFLFAPIVTAFYTIKHLTIWLSSSSKLKSARNEYNEYITLLEQRGELESANGAPSNQKNAWAVIPQQSVVEDHSIIASEQKDNAQIDTESSQNNTLLSENVILRENTGTYNKNERSGESEVGGNNKNKIPMMGIIILLFLIVSGAGVLLYTKLIKPRKIEKAALLMEMESPRYYVFAPSMVLRSSSRTDVDNNKLGSLPYGTELITFEHGAEWSVVKVSSDNLEINGLKGFVASPYILEKSDFCLLNSIFGDENSKEVIETAKCRKALLDYYKAHDYIGIITPVNSDGLDLPVPTNENQWQIFCMPKGESTNNTYFKRLIHSDSKYTDFAVIIKNAITGKRKLLYFYFDDDETPHLFLEQAAPDEGTIKKITLKNGGANGITVDYNNKTTVNNGADRTLQSGNSNTDNVKQISQATSNNSNADINDEKPFVAPQNLDNEEKKEVVIHEIEIIENEEDTDDEVFRDVDKMPEFPGGTTALLNYLKYNVKYPTEAMRNRIEGRVVVAFVVNTDGSICDAEIVKAINPYLDKEALRVIQNMPKWNPGMKKGKPVRVKYTTPINFRLN